MNSPVTGGAFGPVTGAGQSMDDWLLSGQIRLMGWTFGTTTRRNRTQVTDQARITGTPERLGLIASSTSDAVSASQPAAGTHTFPTVLAL